MARGKKLAAVDQGPVEGPWDLPDGWRWERLASISRQPDRGSPSDRFDSHFRYLDVSGISGQRLVPKVLKVAEAPSRARQFVAPGDTVLSGVRVYLRNMAKVNDDCFDVASTAFCVLRPNDELDPDFMFRWISSDYFMNSLLPLQRGNSPPAVLDDDVRAQTIPVPPGDVQRAIVARIETLFAEIDEGEVALAEARTGVETYGKSLLNAAITGELTNDWRRDNPIKESGENLLARILAERRACWDADPKNANKRYSEPVSPDTKGLKELPKSWAWVSLDQLGWSAQYGTSQKCDYGALGESVLRIPNLKAGLIDLADIKRSKGKLALPNAEYVEPGDLLIVRTNGSDALIGRAGMALAPLKEPTYFASYLIRYRLTGSERRWQWIRAFTESSVFRDCVKRSIGSSAGQYNLSMGKLDRFPIALPPEREIDAALAAYTNAASKVPPISDLATMNEQTAQLRQSILAAAFRGELLA